MITREDLVPMKKAARVAGLLYLLIFLVGPFTFFFVRSRIIVQGDAAATVHNIMSSGLLFRLGIAGDAVIFLAEIVLAAILYSLLRQVNRTFALVMMSSRLAEAVLQGVNLLNYSLVLLLLGGAGYLAAFEPGQVDALVLLFLNAYEYVALVWGMFFGLHLLVLGYLLFRSGYFPAILGVLLGLSSLGYLADSFGTFLSPTYEQLFSWIVIVLAVPGELAFTLWLLIRGVRERGLAAAVPGR